MNDAIHYEKFVNEFFLTVKDLIRTNDRSIVKWSQRETLLNNKFHELVDALDTALCDNIDTRSACEHIRRLITASNPYLQECGQSPNVTLLENIGLFISKIFDIFGVGSKEQSIGFPNESSDIGNRETIVMPFLEIIADLREKIRSKAMDLKNNELLGICDELRDEILPNLGVRLEDYEVGGGQTKTRLKLVDKETLLKEKEDKLRAQELKRLEKERKLVEKVAEDAKKRQENKVCPLDMFRLEGDKYSTFDEKGMPTHDIEGKELSKSQIKKLSKLYSNQQKKHEKCLKCNEIIVNNN